MTLRHRLLAVLAPTFLLLIAATATVAYRQSRRTLLVEMNREGLQVGQARAGQLDVLFAASSRVAEGLAAAVESAPDLDPARLAATIRATLERNPLVFGSTVALVPDATPLGRCAPYLCRGPDGLRASDLLDPAYDYPHQPWFADTVRSQRGQWAAPYLDTGGGDTLMTTYATPVRRDGRVVGVATVDVALTELVAAVRRLAVGGTGYAFLVASDGRLVGHPDVGLLSAEPLAAMLARAPSPGLERLLALARTPGDEQEPILDPFRRVPSWVIHSPLPSSGWHLVIVYPAAEILRSLDHLRLQFALVAGGAVLLSAALAFLLSSSVAAPLARLAAQARRYATGEYDMRVDESVGGHEIGQLSHAFNSLGAAIREQLEAVARESAARERYRQELLLAARIQQSLLPGQDPPVPELADRVDVHGFMKPAKEVGGDFYDVFRLEGDRLGFAVGDVSDKGAPAALFTAMARAMVRDFAERGFHPAEVLRRANRTLVRDNPSAMFITLLYGELDPATGRVLLASAGHPDPILRRAGGAVEEPTMPRALPLGCMPSSRYRVRELGLAAGDALVLYSDGLTEAEDPEHRLFGAEGIRRVLEALGDGGSRAVTAALEVAARQHSAAAEPADDLTILVVRPVALGSATPRSFRDQALHLELPAHGDSLPLLPPLVESVARRAGLGQEEADRLRQALAEVTAGAIGRARSPGWAEHVRVDLVPREDGVKAVVTDRGLPAELDPGAPRATGSAAAGAAVDELRYEPNQPEGNRVVMVKRRGAGGG